MTMNASNHDDGEAARSERAIRSLTDTADASPEEVRDLFTVPSRTRNSQRARDVVSGRACAMKNRPLALGFEPTTIHPRAGHIYGFRAREALL
jgi:hypothetical protein